MILYKEAMALKAKAMNEIPAEKWPDFKWIVGTGVRAAMIKEMVASKVECLHSENEIKEAIKTAFDARLQLCGINGNWSAHHPTNVAWLLCGDDLVGSIRLNPDEQLDERLKKLRESA